MSLVRDGGCPWTGYFGDAGTTRARPTLLNAKNGNDCEVSSSARPCGRPAYLPYLRAGVEGGRVVLLRKFRQRALQQGEAPDQQHTKLSTNETESGF